VLHTAVAVINMLELMPPLGGEDEVASDEDTLVDTVVSMTISRSTSLAAAEADRDLHLHLVYGSCRRGSRLSCEVHGGRIGGLGSVVDPYLFGCPVAAGALARRNSCLLGELRTRVCGTQGLLYMGWHAVGRTRERRPPRRQCPRPPRGRVGRAVVEAGWPAGTISRVGSAPRIGGTLRDAVVGRARVHAVPGAHRVDGTLVRAFGRASEGPQSTLTFVGVRWA